ncbi:MAG TPA: SRPBCC domain-containing protein [Streptosporangiaceae bacterium]|nr:SRPBCC domain-containing protein [Streptosporangiaceae bacterium]
MENLAIDAAVEIAADSTRVWDEVATSAGLSGWFVPAEVTPGPAGSVRLVFGPGLEASMPVQVWEPQRRFRFGAALGEPGRSHDFFLAEVAGGCVVRLIDSGVPEEELAPTRVGWHNFLSALKSRSERA